MTIEEITQKIEEVRSQIRDLEKIAFTEYFEGHDPIFFLLNEYCQDIKSHLDSYKTFIQIKK